MNEQILRELKNHTTSVFNSSNLELSSVLDDSFQEVLTKAVERMEREGRTSTMDIYQAKAAFTTFINEMYTYREKRSGQKDLVRYQALNESKSSICPLWPIC